MQTAKEPRVISKGDLKPLIDSHFWSFLKEPFYRVYSSSPKQLMSHNRLDIAIKLTYLLNPSSNFARKLYDDHIKCFTLGKYKEPGNSSKDSLAKYFEDFSKIQKAINLDGFDEKKSLIPVGKNGTILNGAHRVASAISCDRDVEVIALPIDDSDYDYRFFLDRGMSVQNVEFAVSKFIEHQNNSFVACVWPRASGKFNELDALFSKVIYRKTVSLSYQGAHNLLSSVYAGEPWLGDPQKNFPGVKGKLTECFTGDGEIRVVAFQAESLEEVVHLKEKIRSLFKVGKHSVHITDTHSEAVRLSRLLFNRNSLHFLEFGFPHAFSKTAVQIGEFKAFLDSASLDASEIIVDSSAVLAVYGLREAKDIDYLSTKSIQATHSMIDAHDSELRFHGVSKNELILDSDYFFYYHDLKFVSLSQLAAMKRARGEKKDEKDLELMAPILMRSKTKTLIILKEKALYFRAKVRRSFIDFLKLAGLYPIVRKFYRIAQRKR